MYESLIAEYLAFEIPPYVPRENTGLELPKPNRNNLIYVITGVRRCGKTFCLYQLMDQLVASGTDRRCILHLSFDDDRLMPFSDHVLDDLFQDYLRLVPQAEEGCYLFFDEIQETPYWTNFVRRVSEQHKVTFVLTGSSSKLLSTDIPTNFRGRGRTREMWPLSFAEFCDFNAIGRAPRSGVFAAKSARALEAAFESYLDVGGFPGVQGLGKLDRINLLQSYASQIVTKDVLERFGTTSFRVASRFALNALRSTGLKFSLNKQAQTLRSAGISVADEKLYALMDDLEDAHLLFKVTEFSLSIKDNPRSSAKVYSVDPGLSLAVAPASHLDRGQRLETAVFLELKRRFGENRMSVIASYSANGCPEVDFVVGDVLTMQHHELFQVALESGVTRQGGNGRASNKYAAEIGNLETAMALTGLSSATLITLSEERRVSMPSGEIAIVPAWKWFLGHC